MQVLKNKTNTLLNKKKEIQSQILKLNEGPNVQSLKEMKEKVNKDL